LLGVRMVRDRVVEYAALALLAVVIAIIAYVNMLF
jgi:hypothetical protein